MIKYMQICGGKNTGKVFYHDKKVYCDICGQKNLILFVDGKTKDGKCLNMCKKCDEKFGDDTGVTYTILTD